MDSKKPWLSKTMWLNFVLGMCSAVVAFWPNANFVSQWINGNLPLIGMIWGVLGMALRMISKGSISLSDE